MRLTEEQIHQFLQEANQWKRLDEKWIERKFRFKEFLDGIRFVNQVAELAEKQNHHPLISIDYKLVTLRLTTWAEGGLTERDVESVRGIDAIYEENFKN